MTPFITLSGADEATDLGMLAKLDAEIGLLYTTTPEGRIRYPRKRWIEMAAQHLPRVSVHICGSGAFAELLHGRLAFMLEQESVNRIQLNGIVSIRNCELVCAMHPDHTIITQHKPENTHLVMVKATNHALLVDNSGGRGLKPSRWEFPMAAKDVLTSKQVGFAGGLSPDNLSTELKNIADIAQGEWWVDMETSLRVDDYFSFERARDAVHAFQGFFQPAP